VILYRKCTGWCTNDYNVHAYCQASKANPSACLACIIEHGAALSAAGCTPATENAFCKPAPPPGPPAPATTTLTADWDYTSKKGQRDVYSIKEAADGSFAVRVAQGHEAWSTAIGHVSTTRAISITFDSKVKEHGTVNAEYDRITWSDGTGWTKAGTHPPPGPPHPPAPPGPGPSDVDQDPVSTSPAVSALYTGPVVDELQQAVTSDGKYSTTYRVFHSAGMEAHALHVVMDVGPLQPGRELITRFMSDIRNGDTAAGNGTAGPAVIWTDDNGLEFVRRKTNLAQEEAIASNCLGPAGGV
jgi:hypothetical protein